MSESPGELPSGKWARPDPADPELQEADEEEASEDEADEPDEENLQQEGYTVEREDREHMPGPLHQIFEDSPPSTRSRRSRTMGGARMMVIVDISGVHQLPVVPCACATRQPMDVQLLQLGLYPATPRRTKTAFTTRCLDDVLLTNKECRTAIMNYYNRLRRLTNDVFPHTVPVSSPTLRPLFNHTDTDGQDRYRDLLRVSRQWRNLKGRKFHGVGYPDKPEPGLGGLAIACPACPRPGVNMPDGWEADRLG